MAAQTTLNEEYLESLKIESLKKKEGNVMAARTTDGLFGNLC